MMSQASQSHDRFATTRWSVVMHLGGADARGVADALGDLARRYWYPVYAFVRRSGRAPEQAEAVTRTILQRLVGEAGSAVSPIASRQYRAYLYERVVALLDGAAATTQAGDFPAPADLERRYLRDHPQALSPEQVYQRSFAFEVLRRTLARLRREAADSGRADLCRALEPYLTRDPEAATVDHLATQLGMRKVTLIIGLKRLRERLRELAAQELADTVSSAEDLAAEQRSLLAILDEMAA
jgi:RNA polymerase sigma-70 factor (ECF subfamily)